MNIIFNLLIVFLLFAHSLPTQAQHSQSAPWRKVSSDEIEQLLKRSPELKFHKLVKTDLSDCVVLTDPLEKKKCEDQKIQAVSVSHANVSVESKDATIIVFAIVGTVMIVVWLPYLAYLGYKMATHPKEVSTQHMLGVYAVGMGQVGNADGQTSGGYFTSSRYTFLMNSQAEPNLAAGLSAELGYYSLRITDSDQSKFSQYGSFWLAGPTLNFTIMPDVFIKLDLLAGRSFDSQLKLFTKADISANMAFDRWVFGLGVTGLLFRMKEQEGLLNRHSNASLGFNGSVGLRF